VCKFCGTHLPRELSAIGCPEATAQQYEYLPETMSRDEFILKVVSEDESKGFLMKQGLKNFTNADWWSAEYLKYLEPRIVGVKQPVSLPAAHPPPPKRSEKMLRIAKDGEDLGEISESQVVAMLKDNAISLRDFYLDLTKNEWVELGALFTSVS
jgi:hypothetical protein